MKIQKISLYDSTKNVSNPISWFLLLLFPMQWCLGCCGVWWHALHILIVSFQCCYKDGTNGTQDCRYFAGVYLAARLLLCIVFALTLGAYFCAVGTVVLIAIAMLVAIIQPYKPKFAVYNAVDSVFILTLAMWYGMVLCINIAAVKLHQILRPRPSTPPVLITCSITCSITARSRTGGV